MAVILQMSLNRTRFFMAMSFEFNFFELFASGWYQLYCYNFNSVRKIYVHVNDVCNKCSNVIYVVSSFRWWSSI